MRSLPTRQIRIGQDFTLPWNGMQLSCARLQNTTHGDYVIEIRWPRGQRKDPVEIVETRDVEWFWSRDLTPHEPICAECGNKIEDGTGRIWPRLHSAMGWIPRHNDCHRLAIGGAP